MGIETIVLTAVMVTAYQSVPEQTDDSPFITSIGHRTHPFGCAASQDMLANGKIKYGDYICIEGLKCCVVNDCLHERHTNHVDVWVASHAEEAAIKPAKRNVLRIRGKK